MTSHIIGLSGAWECRGWENIGICTMRSFITCTHPQISLGRSCRGEWGGQGMLHAWGKPEGKRPLWRPRRRWEDGIRMDLREIIFYTLTIGFLHSTCDIILKQHQHKWLKLYIWENWRLPLRLKHVAPLMIVNCVLQAIIKLLVLFDKCCG
jgi:hypothetical protein